MAFFSKAGNILKQAASSHSNVEISVAKPFIFQVMRCMSSSKLFVGGLSYGTDQQGLREAFSKYGEVVDAKVIMDRESGNSRGFGFITYSSTEEASSAIQALDGQDLHGRRIRVNYATDRQPRFGQGGGYGGGGYGGGNMGYGGGNYGSDRGFGGNYGASTGYGGGSFEGGSDGGNYGVSGGAGGNGGMSGFGETGNDGTGFGSNVGPGINFGEAAPGGFNQEDSVEGNFRDDDDQDGDYAKRA